MRWQLTDRPADKTRTLYVPAARAQEVRQWISNWKRAKEHLRTLAEASREDLRAANDGTSPKNISSRMAA